MRSTSEFVQVGDTQLNVHQLSLMKEPGHASTLIFLHDALGSVAQWKGFPELVARKTGMNALLYDRQGHGLSSPMDRKRNPDYLHREALEILPELLEKLKIERPILIGHSDGGTIALIHAAHYPAKAVITVAAHIFVEEITLAGIRETGTARKSLVEKLRKYHGDKAGDLFDAWHDTWLDPAFRDWSVEGVIRSIEAPVLAIQGRQDNYGTLAQVDGILNAVQGKKEKQIIDGAGHLPFKEEPGLIANKIRQFLDESTF